MSDESLQNLGRSFCVFIAGLSILLGLQLLIRTLAGDHVTVIRPEGEK